MKRPSNYDKAPVAVSTAAACQVGWRAIVERLSEYAARPRCLMVVECYPGVYVDQVARALEEGLRPALTILAGDVLKPAREIDAMLAGVLTSDPVFGRMNGMRLDDFLDERAVEAAQARIEATDAGLILVVGTGAALVLPGADVLVYADLARWEIQQRQRRGEAASLQYKRGFFVDWRAADRLKKQLWRDIDFLLDTNDAANPKIISGEDFRAALAAVVRRPFRMVPFFDPGPWGGQWMKQVCDLPRQAVNYAWCFDCVPEENSLLLGFGGTRVEVPAIDLVFAHPRELLGDAVHARFGTEFPIRFDFLDTMDGGNLSFQVHPLTEYIQDQFGMAYTQDESYYLLEAAPDAAVYLGLQDDVDPVQMALDLSRAQGGGFSFPVEKYAHRWPARKHDHFLIPAGTVHCSGRNAMVLEISATPYIFTFKLWDWDRMGLDGKPRPVHLDHGLANIQWDRTTEWVRRRLVNRVEPVDSGEGWREERTGLDEREFIETRRHWFTGTAPHATRGGVNVLNLVEGEEAVVESPEGAFEPFVVHYAETFIVPAAVERYTIRTLGGRCATIKAFVRSNA